MLDEAVKKAIKRHKRRHGTIKEINKSKHMGLLEILIFILAIGWLGGWNLGYGGSYVHLILIIIVALILLRFLV